MKLTPRSLSRRHFIRSVLIGGASLSLAPYAVNASPNGSPAPDTAAWYDEIFSIVSEPHELPRGDLRNIHADAYRASTLWGGWYGAWYVDWQKTTRFYAGFKQLNGQMFRWNVMYYDGGEVGDFVLFLDDAGQVVTSGWALAQWQGQLGIQPHWFGMESFYGSNKLFPFKNAAAYGLARPTYPDGRAPESVYEVLGRRSVYDKQEFDYESNNAITDDQAKASGLAAFTNKQNADSSIIGKSGWTIVRLITGDYCNPQLRDYEAWDIARLTGEVAPDGWHVDNYGDVNIFNPIKTAFGVWAQHTFKEYVRRMPPSQSSQLGISSIDDFDITEYVRAGRDLSLGKTLNEQFDGGKWKDDPVFKAFLINHVNESRKFHTAKFDAVKALDRDTTTGRLFSGNTIPLFAGHSMVEGKLDVAHFEWPSWRSYHPKRRPMGLPPAGRSGYVTRLATRISLAGYSIISLYVPNELTGPAHKNLFLAQAFEALTNMCVLDFAEKYLDERSSGTVETANVYFEFLDAHRKVLSRRRFVSDLLVYFDQWADVAATTASSMDLDEFFNEYGGWCDYLTLSHAQWNVITTSSFSSASLEGVSVLVLPSTVTLADREIAAIDAFLAAGGKVIATGGSGDRYGPEGLLLKRDRNALDALNSHQGLNRISGKPGAAYWTGRDASAGAAMKEAIRAAGTPHSIATGAPESVGVTLFRLSDQPGLMLDLNNNDFAVDEDRFRPTPPIEINVRLPENLLHRRLQVEIVAPGQPDAFLAPDKQTLDLKAKSLTLRIDPFTIYQGVVIQTT